MAEVYDTVRGVQGGTITRTLPNGFTKQNKRNSLERVIALHEDVQRALIKEGMEVYQRANFRMNAVQARRIMTLREEVRDAIKSGDPEWIARAQEEYDWYMANRTQVIWSQADVDFHVSLYRPDGNEFYVEAEGSGDRGFEVLRKSLTG